MSEDDGRKIIDAVQRAAFSVEDRQELDTLKAMNEMVGIAAEMMVGIQADMGPRGDVPPEERMRREATLIAKWPEACRRRRYRWIAMPDDMMRAITSFVGRVS